MKIECTIRRDYTEKQVDGSFERVIGTSVVFDTDDGPIIYQFRPTEKDPRHIAEVGNAEHAARLLSIVPTYKAVDAVPSEVSAILKANAPIEEEFIDPRVENKSYTREQLDGMKYPEVKKAAAERFGIALADSAKKEDYVIAILNAQGA